MSEELAPWREVDPQIRLQNIALETSELVARRQMSWAEASNRSSMFMTVVSADRVRTRSRR